MSFIKTTLQGNHDELVKTVVAALENNTTEEKRTLEGETAPPAGVPVPEKDL